jgi:GcrA cell cycle regulator
MSDVTWSDDRVTTLSKLWLEGLSASQIAKRLGGITRNAVIGKVHRLGLSGRPAPATPAASPRTTILRARKAPPRAPSPRPPRPPRPAIVVIAAPPEGPGLVHDMRHLGAHAYKWPIGDPKDDSFSFCGRPAEGRYCTAHERVGARAGAAWRADRDPVVKRALAGLV